MSLFDDLLTVIPGQPGRHATSDPLWRIWQAAARVVVEEAFADGREPVPFGPFGALSLPYFEMGNITSLELFGLDELILFAFYHRNRATYRRVADFGANIGLHSIILSRCGFEVRSFEPDPVHLERLRQNLALNGVAPEVHESAVSHAAGRAEFIRVLGNTTGSHIAGAKSDPYGELERFEVEIVDARLHLDWADLVKIDIEGHEAELVCALPPETWVTTDAVLEIGTEANAEAIFRHLDGSPARIFTQKTGWQRASRVADMPFSHRDGSAFISARDAMPWGGD